MRLHLPDSLKRLRKAKNLTQEDIASALGVSYQAVSRWETGASYPDIELLPALSALLDASFPKNKIQVRERDFHKIILMISLFHRYSYKTRAKKRSRLSVS